MEYIGFLIAAIISIIVAAIIVAVMPKEYWGWAVLLAVVALLSFLAFLYQNREIVREKSLEAFGRRKQPLSEVSKQPVSQYKSGIGFDASDRPYAY